MEKRIPTFLAGMLTMALIGSLGIGALAATNQLTITVDPINIQVNGQTFAPKDAQGNDVPVFAYNGTTYAPLRALAEAYGLEVGYDAEKNMATVGETTTPAPDTTTPPDYSTWSKEDEAAYQEFKGMWEVKLQDSGDKKGDVFGNYDNTPWESYTLTSIEDITYGDISNTVISAREKGFIGRLAYEIRSSDVSVTIYFCMQNKGIIEGLIVASETVN